MVERARMPGLGGLSVEASGSKWSLVQAGARGWDGRSDSHRVRSSLLLWF